LRPLARDRTIVGVYAQFDADDVARDYVELLRRGSVVRRLTPALHEAWRRAIRASARSDELRIRTWSRGGRP
jgi:hypothetical protein